MIGELKYLLQQRPLIVWTSNMRKGQGVCVIPEPHSVEQCRGLNNDSSVSSQCKMPHVCISVTCQHTISHCSPSMNFLHSSFFSGRLLRGCCSLGSVEESWACQSQTGCLVTSQSIRASSFWVYSGNGSMNMARWYWCNRCKQLLYYEYLYLFVYIAHYLHE